MSAQTVEELLFINVESAILYLEGIKDMYASTAARGAETAKKSQKALESKALPEFPRGIYDVHYLNKEKKNDS
jgi:hypothetical protein